MPEVFSLLERGKSESRSGKENLWFEPLSFLRKPVQWDTVSNSQSDFDPSDLIGSRNWSVLTSTLIGLATESGLNRFSAAIKQEITSLLAANAAKYVSWNRGIEARTSSGNSTVYFENADFVFAVLLTGFGKSLIFQVILGVCSCLASRSFVWSYMSTRIDIQV